MWLPMYLPEAFSQRFPQKRTEWFFVWLTANGRHPRAVRKTPRSANGSMAGNALLTRTLKLLFDDLLQV